MTLRADWARENRRWAALAVALGAACSFQDFAYLQESEDTGGGGSSGAGASGGSGAAGASGTSGKGGSTPTGGSGGEDTGGEGGAGASTGGASGSSSGGSGMGGMGGMGGVTAGAGGVAGGGAGGGGGMGAVGELVNPSFESNSTNGWTVEPAAALGSRHIYVQRPTGTVLPPHGTFELATWHMTDAYVVEIYQTVTGLEDGTYTFRGHFSRGPQNAIYMFARNCGGADAEPLNIPETPTDSFVAVALQGIEVVGGSCEVGLHIDSLLEQWMNADLFSLELE